MWTHKQKLLALWDGGILDITIDAEIQDDELIDSDMAKDYAEFIEAFKKDMADFEDRMQDKYPFSDDEEEAEFAGLESQVTTGKEDKNDTQGSK